MNGQLKLTRQFLLDIIAHKYEDDYNDLWYTARKCLKEYLESEEEKSNGHTAVSREIW